MKSRIRSERIDGNHWFMSLTFVRGRSWGGTRTWTVANRTSERRLLRTSFVRTQRPVSKTSRAVVDFHNYGPSPSSRCSSDPSAQYPIRTSPRNVTHVRIARAHANTSRPNSRSGSGQRFGVIAAAIIKTALMNRAPPWPSPRGPSNEPGLKRGGGDRRGVKQRDRPRNTRARLTRR
jgi:hypothetical protein